MQSVERASREDALQQLEQSNRSRLYPPLDSPLQRPENSIICFCETDSQFQHFVQQTQLPSNTPPKNVELVGIAVALFATLNQLTRLPNLLIDQLDKLSQLRSVAAFVGVAPDPLLPLDRLRPGGLLPRLPLPD